MAEFTLGAILAVTRNITRGHEALRRGEWRGDLFRADETGNELSDMTAGVIGYGEIGTRVVRWNGGRRPICGSIRPCMRSSASGWRRRGESRRRGVRRLASARRNADMRQAQ